MRIIVEGPDAAGKTTLIQLMQQRFDKLTLVRNDKEDKQDFEVWWDNALTKNYRGHIPLHDRFFYSELVYGPVIRGKIAVPQYVTDEIRAHLRRTALLIYARPHTALIRHVVNISPQMKGVRDHIQELVEVYDVLMSQEAMFYGRRFYRYDYKKEAEPEAVMETVRGYLAGEIT